jgi:branched-chain amino acid transport system substrate-binding protein
VRAANEIGLNTKMFGGAMIGLLATPIKLQLGPLMNGLVIMESFVPAPTLDFPGLKAMLEKYQAKAPSLGIDPLGYGFTPFAYAAGQVVAQAVEATKSFDHDKLADYIHPTNSRRWPAKLPSARTASGRSHGSSSPNFRV